MIVGFERSLVIEGSILVKFWLHISDEEQLARFGRRENDPFKRWKLTDEDWRNRARNRDYDVAAEEMFARTDHELAPWDVVAAEQKRYARIAVLERLNERIEEGMRRFDLAIPDPARADRQRRARPKCERSVQISARVTHSSVGSSDVLVVDRGDHHRAGCVAHHVIGHRTEHGATEPAATA